MYYIKRKKKTQSGEPKRTSTTNTTLVKKLDRVFALYIRLRDIMPNGYVKCISCGKIKRFEDVDCGHFHSRRHMATRFDEDNCHAECKYDNRFSADHLIGYERNLIQKIGRQRFDLLNAKAHSSCHWMESELTDKLNHYKGEVKRLSEEKGVKVKI